MAGLLLSGALVCFGIAALATESGDVVSSFLHRVVRPLPGLELPQLHPWIRSVRNHISDISGNLLAVERDDPVKSSTVTPVDQNHSVPIAVQPPEAAKFAWSEKTIEPMPPALSKLSLQTPRASSSEPSVSRQDTDALVLRGDASLSARDITSARLFYERAIEMGDGHAAVGMGATFDPAFLERAGIRGTNGDQQKALFWYRYARGLGDVEADRLLKNFERQ
jgi:hypothetical protein